MSEDGAWQGDTDITVTSSQNSMAIADAPDHMSNAARAPSGVRQAQQETRK